MTCELYPYATHFYETITIFITLSDFLSENWNQYHVPNWPPHPREQILYAHLLNIKFHKLQEKGIPVSGIPLINCDVLYVCR